MIRALALSMLALSAIAQPMPPAPLIAPPVKTQAVFVVATAWAGTTESDYSTQLSTTTTNNSLAVAWDHPGASSFKVYWGTNSGIYLWSGTTTNKSYSFQVVPTPPVSNFFRAYPQDSTSPNGPFSFLPGSPYFVVTNTGGGQRYFRLLAVATNAP